MKKKALLISLASLILLGCTDSANKDSTDSADESTYLNQKVEISYEKKDLGLTERDFLIGTAGYAPPNFPNSTPEQVKQYWYEVNQTGEVYGVHTDWKDRDIIEIAANNFNGEILLVLGFQSADEWVGSREQFKREMLTILDKYPQIKYLAIGNEINDLYLNNPAAFNNFVDAYKEFYLAAKEFNPNLIVFTTFQYEWLIGEGDLTGRAQFIAPQLEILSLFDGYIDAVGITLYPFFDYFTPEEVPPEYLEQISIYSDKPIIITETGWISRPGFSGSSVGLSSTGYVGSEEEQAQYLLKLLEISNNSNVMIVDWIFLNDPYDWENIENTPTLQTFESAGLKSYVGKEKLVWNYWLSLKDIEYSSIILQQ